MMRALCTVAALMMLATAAFAGSAMTPQQAMEKTMNCPVCSAWTPDVRKLRPMLPNPQWRGVKHGWKCFEWIL